MKKRIFIGMLALVLLILPVSLYLQINQAFRQSLESARNSALREESAIARALSMELQREDDRAGSDTTLRRIAYDAQRRYGSANVQVLLYSGRNQLNGQLPVTAPEILLEAEERSTYLSSADHNMYIVHPLDAEITLITVTDFSPFYEARAEQTRFALWICLGGTVLAAVLALLISGGLTRSLRRLAQSADAVRSGADLELKPSGKKDDIGKLTDAFAAMNDAVKKREESLREQAEQRQRLIDALAHEMRTPLTSVVSAARLIQNGNADAETRERMCDLIVRESRRLAEMDENLMKLTRMNGAEPEKETFSLKEMAEEALAAVPETELAGEDSTVTADRALVVQLLRNLVNNAAKSGTETPVRVTLHEGGFTVSDEGRGMTEEEVRRCTEPFWKADPARTRASGGAGLGLTICREIAELHGAKLEIRSEPGRGTNVEFTLPLHPGEDAETADSVSCD